MMMVVISVSAQKIEHVYHFGQPTIGELNGYSVVKFPDCEQLGNTGEPVLPWQSVKIILPMNQEAASIEVSFSDFVELEGTYNLYPYQMARPLSETKVIPFAKNEAIYASKEVYPATSHSDVNTQYLNGVSFAFSGFTPVRYIPSTGKVSYAKTVTVSIEMAACKEDNSSLLWLTPSNRNSIKNLAQNAEMIDSYNGRGRSVPGYDLLVITPEAWAPRFDEYVEMYNQRGIRTRVATTESIYSSMTGRDNQEKIRNYIIQEYQDNGISMVNLGGDVALVPFRGFYCYVSDGYVDDAIPSDMYYACLDGTWNDDNDNLWGEIGEADLLQDIGIGRMTFNNDDQFETLMGKTFSYLNTPVLGEFRRPILGAEHLGDGYYGSDDMERLIGQCDFNNYTTIGFPVDYDFVKVYATPSHGWSGSEFRDAIVQGGNYVNHVGHANTDYVAGWTGSMLRDNNFAGANGVDHNFMFFHSHGCICGDYSHSCVLEKLLTLHTACVVTTGNSRYGWYIPWGDGPGAHLNREFMDAYFNDRIPFVGMAMRECKIKTAPTINLFGEDGAMRWNFYDLNVLGDVAICPWLDEPFVPDVQYSTGLMVGATSTEVHVSQNGTALNNFRCSLFHGDDLLGFALTDNNGNATLTFSPALDVVGEMTLVVTGPNAWPQRLAVNGFAQGQAYVCASAYSYNDNGNHNGVAEFGEAMTIDVDFTNTGNATANNVVATLSSTDSHISTTSSSFNAGSINGNATRSYDNAFAFNISNDIADMTRVVFNIQCTDGNGTWNSSIPLYVMAPTLAFGNVVFDDSQGNGNGLIDPGETIILHVHGSNNGHATAPATSINASCNYSEISMISNHAEIGNVQPDGSFTGDISFTSDPNTVGGTVFNMNISINSGSYVTNYIYSFSVGYATETFESGDFSFMSWDFGGEQPWVVTDAVAHQGNYSAQSGTIEDDQVSDLIISTNLLIGGDLSFYYKTSTEKLDYLILYVDDKVIDFWSQDTDWTRFSHTLTAGEHVIKWRFDKSPKNTGGEDHVWVDDIVFPPACLVLGVENVTTTKENSIYPNPNNGDFVVSLAKDNSEVSVFNQLGQMVKHIGSASGYQRIGMENAASGVYFVRIQNDSNTETLKMVVK